MQALSLRHRLCALGAVLLLSGGAWAGGDWPYWVGPQYTGISPEKNLPERWDPRAGEGSNVLWAAPIGSRSTPVIMNGRLYLITNSFEEDIHKAGEKVVCLDALTGHQLWEHNFNVYLTDVPIERVGWSSVVADPATGNVYAQGVCGYFCCLNGETGELVWDHSMHEEFGFLTTYGGRTNHPLVHENNVLISAVVIGWGDMARPTHRFLAMDKTNGLPVWFEGTRPLPMDTTYSAPVLAAIDGELQMIFASGDGGIHGFQPRTGKKIWSYYLSEHGINTTPLVVGNRVYCGHSEENLDSTTMGAVVCIDATKRSKEPSGDITKEATVWKTTEYGVGRCSPMMIDGRLYIVTDSGKLNCLNPETGEALGPPVPLGTMMRANLLYADGKIYANEVNGRGYILKPTPTGAEVIYKYRLPRGEESHGSAIAWNSRVYLPTTGKMYCIGLSESQTPPGDLPDLPEEAPRPEDDAPAQLQLAPVELLLRPGTRQRFQARLYDAQGRYLRLAKPGEVKYQVDGLGSIDDQGLYSVQDSENQHATAIITAKFGEIQGRARIRIVPPLDWSFNFDDGKVPPTWVGCSYRHVAMDWELLSKLRQANPLASDLYIYFMTEFANTPPGPMKGTFDDSTPQQRWTNFLRFLNLDGSPEKPKNIADAHKYFDEALELLVAEKVLASFDWSEWDRSTGNGDETVPEPRLTIKPGERKIDGNGVICKITTIPLGTRSQGWMGQTDLHDYTIQTDMLCFSRLDKLPDAGVIGQRYTLDLMGASQQLQIRTWTPQLNRFSNHHSFTWKPDTWYTLKFRTAVEDGKAVLRGKIWKRGDKEPEEWTVEAVDPQPNVTGSPGLFGNCKDGEVFYDNLTVTRNSE